MKAAIELHQSLWQSFRRLPRWVRLWMAAVLLPVNLLSLFLLDFPARA